MAVFVLSGLLMGGLIGGRLTVLALLPAVACTIGIAAIVSILSPGVHDWTALHVIALVVFLQVGYLCGAGLRMFVHPPTMVGERERLRSS
jgi:hypothetical protein